MVLAVPSGGTKGEHMKATAVLFAVLLWASPAAAQESYDQLPPEGRNIVDALDAIEYWASPNDWKAYTVTVIWAMDAYRLMDTQGLHWETLWNDLIEWENGTVYAEWESMQGRPLDRAGYCERLTMQKARYAIGAGVMVNSAALWRGVAWAIPATTAFLANVKWRMEFVGHLSAIFSANLALITAMHPSCDTAD
jgi:hypothetical protein